MKYQVVLEFDPQTNSYLATVPGLPIFVDSDTEADAIKMAREAIEMYFEEVPVHNSKAPRERAGHAKIVTVEVDASASR